jgi:sec-independent protein translocase protein TatA
MGSFSLWHWIIVLVVVLLLFGRGRISEVMGDFGKGISSFKKGLSEAEKEAELKSAVRLEAPTPVQPVVRSSATPVGPAGETVSGAAPVRSPEEEAAARRDPS